MRTSLPTLDASITLAQMTQRSPMVESMIWLPDLMTVSRAILRTAAQDDVRLDGHVGLDLDRRVDPRRAGIGNRHTFNHVALEDDVLDEGRTSLKSSRSLMPMNS